jgi:hypothetical protein
MNRLIQIENQDNGIPIMKAKKNLLGAGALLVVSALAFAHHVPVGLSHLFGPEIVREVLFDTQTGTFGVPSHRVGGAELPDHGVAVGLAAGDSFQVMDESGTIDVVTFHAADFADIALADTDEAVEVINAQATVFEAVAQNGYLTLRGTHGGSLASLTVIDGIGGPLFKLGMGGGTTFGRDDLELTLSIPDASLNLAGRPYVVLASSTAGTTTYGQQTIPFAVDGLTMPFLSAALAGRLQGFVGVLDGNSDASALLRAAQIQRGFAGSYPDKLYLSFLVFGANGRIEYVSNAFTVDFR